MHWSEIDLKERLWTIPAERMKADRAHEVPLAPEAIKLLMALPRFTRDEYVFSTTHGEKPVNGFSKIDLVSNAADGKSDPTIARRMVSLREKVNLGRENVAI